VKIYWTLKSITELKDLSFRERGKRWRSAYISAFRHWQTWGGLALCGAFSGAGAYFGGMAGTVIFAGLGGFIYGQIVTRCPEILSAPAAGRS
jgi:Na+(H+)/acetate symporter ActP